MIPAPIPDNESLRLASLTKMDLLSTPREADIDLIARLAQQILKTDQAMVSLVDQDRIWHKARFGADETEWPRNSSFCGHAILSEHLFMVPDADLDERFATILRGTPARRSGFMPGSPWSIARDSASARSPSVPISQEP